MLGQQWDTPLFLPAPRITAGCEKGECPTSVPTLVEQAQLFGGAGVNLIGHGVGK
jgi:hypothetical protein